MKPTTWFTKVVFCIGGIPQRSFESQAILSAAEIKGIIQGLAGLGWQLWAGIASIATGKAVLWFEKSANSVSGHLCDIFFEAADGSVLWFLTSAEAVTRKFGSAAAFAKALAKVAKPIAPLSHSSSGYAGLYQLES